MLSNLSITILHLNTVVLCPNSPKFEREEEVIDGRNNDRKTHGYLDAFQTHWKWKFPVFFKFIKFLFFYCVILVSWSNTVWRNFSVKVPQPLGRIFLPEKSGGIGGSPPPFAENVVGGKHLMDWGVSSPLYWKNLTNSIWPATSLKRALKCNACFISNFAECLGSSYLMKAYPVWK